jgi:hypothetical protein
MNTLTYCYYAFFGLAFCMVLTARITFGNVETVSWPMWILGGTAYFIAIKVLWRVIQRKLFGDFLVVDIKKFVAPPICATCCKEAAEMRTAFFSSTNAGPISIRQHAELPLKLCVECARRYDSKLLKGIKGIRISRVVYEKWTVQIKNRDYFNAVLELNRQSGAVMSA